MTSRTDAEDAGSDHPIVRSLIESLEKLDAFEETVSSSAPAA